MPARACCSALSQYDLLDKSSTQPTRLPPPCVKQVGFVPTACGGTNLFQQWAPGGDLWRNMVTNTAAALNALGCQGRLAGIIWVQVVWGGGVGGGGGEDVQELQEKARPCRQRLVGGCCAWL